VKAAGDYAKHIHISASPERVYDALRSADGFAAWWAPATRSAAEGGELRVTFAGIEDPLVLQVEQAKRPATATWNVRECSFLPDWAGTTAAVTLSPSGDGGCDVQFQHQGLRPQLERYNMCSAGWDQYVPSLRDYIETGAGNPFRGR
jgi:uncharacterized protein YndB with AHSA1/START domain